MKRWIFVLNMLKERNRWDKVTYNCLSINKSLNVFIDFFLNEWCCYIFILCLTCQSCIKCHQNPWKSPFAELLTLMETFRHFVGLGDFFLFLNLFCFTISCRVFVFLNFGRYNFIVLGHHRQNKSISAAHSKFLSSSFL